jgi:NTE family protein
VPILVLNATTLNTGRNWQFTAQKMGEPETEEEKNKKPPADRIDKKSIRLRRADSYANITAVKNKEGFSLQNLSLGHAVAASACVPGLFPPLSITGLYKDIEANEHNQAITPQLVDGGVFDNQAIDGLLQNDCNCFVISDAAGQMGVENEVATGAISVLLRVSSVLQDRVRTENLNRLFTVVANKNDIAFIDLRRGLAMRASAWIDEKGNQEPDKVIPPYSYKDFNVDVRVQEKLSAMRTDLDAFTEVEAYSLMLDGYRMTENELQNFKPDLKCSEKTEKPKWDFNQIAPWMEKPTEVYLQQLEIAKNVPFKALKMMPWRLGVPLALTVFTPLYLGHSQITDFLFHQVTVSALIIAIAGFGLNAIAPKLVKAFAFLKYLSPQAQFSKRILQVAGLLLGTLFFKVYLNRINPMFLTEGSLETLKKKSPHS